MKQNNYDRLLFGCHPLCEVAAAYFPCDLTASSTRAFRRQVKLYPRLYTCLCELGYTEHTNILMPIHIAAVVREWGMPGEAFMEMRRRIEKEKSTDIF